eukprot:TRINITY_DN109_c0_g1_i9.p1 TRINITY_DN109_c0_g1~~TRINITY_DN109_c0_g1_i9.p1  ORF type:complete len:147 (-),score=51.56 TRINITY_DN109_c0_g1_i9:143-583(-)
MTTLAERRKLFEQSQAAAAAPPVKSATPAKTWTRPTPAASSGDPNANNSENNGSASKLPGKLMGMGIPMGLPGMIKTSSPSPKPTNSEVKAPEALLVSPQSGGVASLKAESTTERRNSIGKPSPVVSAITEKLVTDTEKSVSFFLF